MPQLVEVQSNANGVARRLELQIVDLQRVLTFAGKEISRGMRLDFERTTRQWSRRPKPDEQVMFVGSTLVVDVGIADEIYAYVDRGTRPHDITGNPLAFQWGGPGSYIAHTKPGVLLSGASSQSGDLVFRRMVRHPGFPGRGFSKMIKEKWDRRAGEIMERYVRNWSEQP